MDIATLGFKVDTTGLKKGKKSLDGLSKSGEKAEASAEKSSKSINKSFGSIAGAIGLVAASVAGLSKLVSVTREFDILNAQLVTATGSAENAAKAFEGIQDFAAKTPFDLAQVTDAFVKLQNLGLTPSERALTSYGNTASAMGKDLNQLIEAVADAATGEFERLKEFGIKSSQQGDQVAFTFKGVTTTVKKEAEAIEGFLMRLGETDFAGAMAQRVDTLDGAISNLGDSWNKLFLTISGSGVGDTIEDSVRLGISALETLDGILKSGQFDASLAAISESFKKYGEDIERTITTVSEIITLEFSSLGLSGGDAARVFSENFDSELSHMPSNVRATVQLIAIEIASFVDYGAEYGQAFGEILGVKLAQTVEEAKLYGRAIGDALNPFDEGGFDLDAELERLASISAEMTDEIIKNAEKKAATTAKIRRESIIQAIDEREESVETIDAQISAIGELGEAYEQLIREKSSKKGDSLAGFGINKKDLIDIENIYSAVEEAVESLEEENKAFTESLQDVIDKADPLGAKLREVAAEMEILKKGLAAGAIDPTQFEKLSKALTNSLKDAGKDAGKEIPDELSQGMGTVSDALASALMSGDWDNVGEAIGGVLGSAVGDVVSDAVSQSVGGMAGAIAGPLAGAIAGAAVSIAIDEIGDFLKGDYIDPSEERQRTQGTGSVLGNISAKSESISRSNDLIADATDNIVNINRGMLRALESLRGDLANVAGMTAGARGDFSFAGPKIDENLFQPVYDSIGVGLLGLGLDLTSLLGLDLLGDLLGGSSKKVDEGIRILGGNITDLVNDSVVQAFASFKSRKNIFDDYDVSNKFQNFEDDINDQFELAFASIIDSVFEGASAFGVSNAAINKAIQEFEIETTIISLKGLNTEEQQAEIEAVFSKIFDDLTLAVIPNLQEFQALGEGLGETLARVSTSVQLTSEAADSLGFSLGENRFQFLGEIDDGDPFNVMDSWNKLLKPTADMYAKAANELVNLAGGVEAFSQALASYEKNFLSAQENTENLSRRLGDAMGELPLPETRQGFVDLMASQTSATAAGRENIAMLLQLQGVADQYYSDLEANQESLFNLEMQLLQAQGKEQEALTMARNKELEAATEAEKALLLLIYAQEDATRVQEEATRVEEEAARAQEEAAQLQRSRTNLEIQLLELQGATVEALQLKREQELSTIDESLIGLQELIYTEQDLISVRKEQEEAAKSAFDTLRRSISLAKEQASLALDSAKLANDLELERIAGLRDSLEQEKSLRDSNLADTETALNNAFNAEMDRVRKGAASEIEQINSISSARSAALNAERSAVSASMGQLSSIVSSIGSAIGGNQSTDLASALESAKRGDFSAAAALDVNALSNLNMADFASLEAFNIQSAINKNQLSEISGLAGGQLSDAERQIKVIESQINANEANASRQIDAINEQADREVQALEDQLKSLLGIDDSTLSMAEAIEAFNAAKLELDELNYNEELEKLEALELSAKEVYQLHEQAYNDEIERLDGILDDGERQLNALLGIDDSVMSVVGAVSNLQASINAAIQSPPATVQSAQSSNTQQIGETIKLNELTDQMKELQKETLKSNKATANILQRLEIDGLDVRVIS